MGRITEGIPIAFGVILFGAITVAIIVAIVFFLLPHQQAPATVIEEQKIDLATCQCVMFRLDDIQDYWMADDQIAIMNIFEQENVPLTIGIIANQFGNDTRIVNYIDAHRDSLTIANHGWNHEDFATFTLEQQTELMRQASVKIEKITGEQPTMFLAPYNSANDDTMMAAKVNGINIMSADLDYNTTAILHIPQTSEVTYYANDTWNAIPEEALIVGIMGDMETYGFAVVTMHPPDNELADIEHLLDVLQREDVLIVSMTDIKIN